MLGSTAIIKTMEGNTQKTISGVVIGASAGGIDALQNFFDELQGVPSCPIILCLHRHPTQGESHFLEEFFAKHAGFPFVEAHDKEAPKPGHGYVAPPNYHLLIERDQTFSLSVEERVNYCRPSIDLFFESAVDAWQDQLVGILLTGANADGAEGLLKIREAGGHTIAQSLKEAEALEMPSAAINMGAACDILHVKEIAQYLNKTIMVDSLPEKPSSGPLPPPAYLKKRLHIGVISDTHGLLRESAIEALQGVDHILHIGDICDDKILQDLQKIAPLHVVRGNCDFGKWAEKLPMTETVELGKCWIYMIHDLSRMDIDPAGQCQVVLHGHTHMPEIQIINKVLYFNPGSAGPPRAEKPISIGFLDIDEGNPSATWQHLKT